MDEESLMFFAYWPAALCGGIIPAIRVSSKLIKDCRAMVAGSTPWILKIGY